MTSAAEWLLDNFYVVEDQLGDIQTHLPAGYCRKLPKLAQGPLHGFPRVYGLAWAIVAHTDSRFDPAWLVRFVWAYQRVQPLTIGELWAVPISLRIVMIENLRRLAVRIVGAQMARQEADKFVEELAPGARTGPAELIDRAIRGLSSAALWLAFAAQLVQRLRSSRPVVRGHPRVAPGRPESGRIFAGCLRSAYARREPPKQKRPTHR